MVQAVNKGRTYILRHLARTESPSVFRSRATSHLSHDQMQVVCLKVMPIRTIFDKLAAFQSCQKSGNFNNFDNFYKNVDLGQLWKNANRSNIVPFGQILFC